MEPNMNISIKPRKPNRPPDRVARRARAGGRAQRTPRQGADACRHEPRLRGRATRCHHRQRGDQQHRCRFRRLGRRSAVDRQCLHHHFRSVHSDGRRTWRPPRRAARFHRRLCDLCAGVARLRAGASLAGADHRAPLSGSRRSDSRSQFAGAAQSRLSAGTRAPLGGRYLGGRRELLADRGTVGRRRVDRTLRLAQHLLDQSADRPCRHLADLALRDRDRALGGAHARHTGPDHGGAGAGIARRGDDRRRRTRLERFVRAHGLCRLCGAGSTLSCHRIQIASPDAAARLVPQARVQRNVPDRSSWSISAATA